MANSRLPTSASGSPSTFRRIKYLSINLHGNCVNFSTNAQELSAVAINLARSLSRELPTGTAVLPQLVLVVVASTATEFLGSASTVALLLPVAAHLVRHHALAICLLHCVCFAYNL